MYKTVGLLFVFAGSLVSASLTLGQLGKWLIVEEPLRSASAIIVLGGHLPFRAMEAARIYHEGWAPEVWLIQAKTTLEERALARLGIQHVRDESYNRAILERLGIPSRAIFILDETAQNTADEMQVIARKLKEVRGKQVIIVTSKAHSRRVRVIWRTLIGDTSQAVIRYATDDPYDPDRWWQHTGSALTVCREVLGLLNAWAGFPLRPEPQ